MFLLPLLEKSHVATFVVGWQCELAVSFISSVVVYKATSNQLCGSRTAGCKGAQTPDGGRIVMSQSDDSTAHGGRSQEMPRHTSRLP